MSRRFLSSSPHGFGAGSCIMYRDLRHAGGGGDCRAGSKCEWRLARALRNSKSLGYRIDSIEVRQLPIFDEEPGAKHQALYRLADQLHIDTRDSVIESQLLFRTGDLVSQRKIVETERNLRDLRYIREPSVRASQLP